MKSRPLGRQRLRQRQSLRLLQAPRLPRALQLLQSPSQLLPLRHSLTLTGGNPCCQRSLHGWQSCMAQS